MDEDVVMTDASCRGISPESDFYGSPETVRKLEQRVESMDVPQFLPAHAAVVPAPTPAPERPMYNRYAELREAWQLTETIPEFVTRMPPATTTGVPWIWVTNPYDGVSSGEGDIERPVTNRAAVNTVMEGGMERLHLLSDFVENARKHIKSKSALSKELQTETEKAAKDLLQLALAARVTCGKWMLFISPHNVNEVWKKVALATSRGELGIAAKVAAQEEDSTRPRLICVYTANFSKVDDVGRVLRRMRELGLCTRSSKRIYYKPDVFTYLGLDGQNKWNIRPSIYASKNLFGYMEARDSGMTSADEKEDGWFRYVETKR